MKNVILIFATCMMSLVMASCGGNSNSSEADRIAQLEDSIKTLNNKLQSNTYTEAQTAGLSSSTADASLNNNTNDLTTISSATGTYEFSDGHNTWVLVVNDDETAYIYNKKGGENIKAYGSWDKYNYENYNRIDLQFIDKQPEVWFPSGEKKLKLPEIYEGYIYNNFASREAKNPELRLPIRKIK